MATQLLSSAWFPNEILQEIVLATWSSPLTVDERISFMTTSLLVSNAWTRAFILVSSRDVYIPCASYAHQFCRILRRECPIYDPSTRALPESLCRSLTFQLHNATKDAEEHQGSPRSNENFRAGQALDSTLYTIYGLRYLPHLRRISIEYLNWGFGDIFDHYRLVAFPEQVIELELKYLFTDRVPAELINELRSNHERCQRCPWSMPSIRCLSVTGAPDAVVSDMLSTCPNVETLVKDGVKASISS